MNRSIQIAVLFALTLMCWPVARAQSHSIETFLSLPFEADNVILVNSPVYTTGGNHWSYFDKPYPFDFATNSVDSLQWFPFDVKAAAPGYAMQTCSGDNGAQLIELQAGTDLTTICKSGYGRFVVIKHDVSDDSGHPVFTLYAHLDSVPDDIPFKTKGDVAFSSWKRVERGETIGIAGSTSKQGCTKAESTCTHLHFEAFSSSAGYQKDIERAFDPYGISSPSNLKSRSAYLINDSIQICEEPRLWLDCPPTYRDAITAEAGTQITFAGTIDFIWFDGFSESDSNPVLAALRELELGQQVSGKIVFDDDGVISSSGTPTGESNLFRIQKGTKNFRVEYYIGGYTWSTGDLYDLQLSDNVPSAIADNSTLGLPVLRDVFEILNASPGEFPDVFDNAVGADLQFLATQNIATSNGEQPDLLLSNTLPLLSDDLNFDSTLSSVSSFGALPIIGIEALGRIDGYDASSAFSVDFKIDPSSIEVIYTE